MVNRTNVIRSLGATERSSDSRSDNPVWTLCTNRPTTHTWPHKHCHIGSKVYHYTVFWCCLSPGGLCWPVGSTVWSRGGWWRWIRTASSVMVWRFLGLLLPVLFCSVAFYFPLPAFVCVPILTHQCTPVSQFCFCFPFTLLLFACFLLVFLCLFSGPRVSSVFPLWSPWLLVCLQSCNSLLFCRSSDFSAFCFLHLGYWIDVSSSLKLAFILFPSGGERLQRWGNKNNTIGSFNQYNLKILVQLWVLHTHVSNITTRHLKSATALISHFWLASWGLWQFFSNFIDNHPLKYAHV